MKKRILSLFVACLALTINVQAQTDLKKVYDEEINPLEQIDRAITQARTNGKFVVCQVGGNWCPWCLRFAAFVTSDTTINRVVNDNFEYIHVNYNPKKTEGDFGFPVFVVLDEQGKVLHIQDSSFLEEGQGYDKEKVLRFFRNWTPEAVGKQ